MKKYLPLFLIYTITMAVLIVTIQIPTTRALCVIGDNNEPDNSGPQATVYDVSAFMHDENKTEYTSSCAYRAYRASSPLSLFSPSAIPPSSMYCWGRVTDAVSGNAIGGVGITATYCDSTVSEERRATSFQDGTYVIYTTIAGYYKITVNTPGYQEFVASIEFDNSFSRIDLYIPLIPEETRAE